MSSDWSEIKRLAADLQKAQLTTGLQRLSESNCVEIVSILQLKEFIDVFFSNNGREYVTPDHLENEVSNELFANGGRVNLAEISKSINVDLYRVENTALKISEKNKNIHCVLGQLIEENYICGISKEINEKLQQKGEISISDLTIQFDLPSEFLQQNVLEKYLGNLIQGRQDSSNPRIFFTQLYIQRCKAKIRGAIAGAKKPTTVASILQQIDVQETIFRSFLHENCMLGNVSTKHSNAQFVPHVYAKMQLNWVTSFYKQNGYLEYHSLSKLGIVDTKLFIKKNFPSEDIIFLDKFAIAAKMYNLTLPSILNECDVTNSFVDLSNILPSSMSEKDIEELFKSILISRSIPNNFIYIETIVFSKQFLNNILQPCEDFAYFTAKIAAENRVLQGILHENKHDVEQDLEEPKSNKRSDRRKKTYLGRESKVKASKKNMHSEDTLSGEEDDFKEGTRPSQLKKENELVSIRDIEQIIAKQLEKEGLEHLSTAIAALYYTKINDAACKTCQKLCEETRLTKLREVHSSFQDRFNMLLADMRLYEKGIKFFPVDVQIHLNKYLIKSLGNDICNEVTIYFANYEMKLDETPSSNLNIDQRNKIANACANPEYRTALLKLNNAINKTVEDIMYATEDIMRTCGMVVRKIDKKKERALIAQHKEKLHRQLLETDSHALVLHLTVLIIFIRSTGCLLHASGRFVSHILTYVRSNLSEEENTLLTQFHDHVLKLLQENRQDETSEELSSLQRAIKELAKSYE